MAKKPNPAVKSDEAPVVKDAEAPVVKDAEAPAVQNDEAPAVKDDEAPAVKDDEAPAVQNDEAPAVQNDEAPKVQLRVKSASAPFRRGGLVFGREGEWQEVSVSKTPEDVARVVTWIQDPNLVVEMSEDGENWEPLTEVPEGISEFLEAVSPPPKD